MHINKPMSLKVNSATLLTLFAPKNKPYSVYLFKTWVQAVAALFKVKEYAAVAEPCPKSPEDWHFHMWLPFHLSKAKYKTIHKGLIAKLKALTGQKNEPNFTKPAKSNLWQKLLNDLRYSRGLSDKQKEKHDVLVTPGIDKIQQELQVKAKDQAAGTGTPDFGCVDEAVAYYYAERGMDFTAQYDTAIIAKDYALVAELAVNRGKLERMINTMRELKQQKELAREMEELVLWEGQQFMIDRIKEATPGRSLPVFVDPEGNSGKSTVQDWLHFHEEHQEFTNAKTADIAYAYHGAPLVTFNLSRATDMSKVNYQVIENLLDGKVFSSKYESGMKRFKKPRVALFCNSEPDLDAMSSDRWQIYRRCPKRGWYSSQTTAPLTDKQNLSHIYGSVGDVLAACDPSN